MTPDQVARAQLLLAERAKFVAVREDVERGGLGVTIRGTYQDEAMNAAVRPTVLGTLDGRIAALDVRLRALGVEL